MTEQLSQTAEALGQTSVKMRQKQGQNTPLSHYPQCLCRIPTGESKWKQ